MANTCPPGGNPNAEGWEIEGGKQVYFVTLRDIYEGEQILWRYHDIFDKPTDLANFADPSSCDLEMEEWQSPSATLLADDSYGPACPSRHSTGRSRADDAGYQRSRCLEYIREGSTLWSCDHYNCDFDICCLCCEAWLLRTKAVHDDADHTDHTKSCLDERSQCTTAHCDLYDPANQNQIVQSLRALATEGQLEALKDLDLDMDVRSAKAEICRAQITVLKREIQLMLEADISSKMKAKSTNSSPPPSPSYSPLPVAPPTSSIYYPLANESPIYSPEPRDQEPEKVEQKDFAPQHAEMHQQDRGSTRKYCKTGHDQYSEEFSIL